MDKEREDKIRKLIKEHKIAEAQTEYFKAINESRKHLDRSI